MIITGNSTELSSVANKTQDHHWISLCQRRNPWQQIFSSTFAWTSTSVLVQLLKILGNSWWRLTIRWVIQQINMFDSLLVEVITRFETHKMFLFHSKLLTFQQPCWTFIIEQAHHRRNMSSRHPMYQLLASSHITLRFSPVIGCDVLLVQDIPSSVYVDNDQLFNLNKLNKLKRIKDWFKGCQIR